MTSKEVELSQSPKWLSPLLRREVSQGHGVGLFGTSHLWGSVPGLLRKRVCSEQSSGGLFLPNVPTFQHSVQFVFIAETHPVLAARIQSLTQ